jgi:hypothetical protein
MESIQNLKDKIVSNNLTKILKGRKMTSKELRTKLSEIGHPMQLQRYYDVKKNRREMYLHEAIIISEILGVKYTELVNGSINKLINKPIN